MNAANRSLQQILAERAVLVAEVARLNAEQLRNSQRAGGLEVELLSWRRETEAGDGGEAARRSLAEAEAREVDNDGERLRCEAALEELTRRLEELDRELAGT